MYNENDRNSSGYASECCENDRRKRSGVQDGRDFKRIGLSEASRDVGGQAIACSCPINVFCEIEKIANNGDGLNTNIFTTFLLKKCLFIYTYWHFGSAKKPNFRTKKAPYIGICQFKVLLLSGTPRVRIAPGTPIPRKHCVFGGLLFLKLLLSNCPSSFHAMHTIVAYT